MVKSIPNLVNSRESVLNIESESCFDINKLIKQGCLTDVVKGYPRENIECSRTIAQ